jgi:ribonucleoside-diphosphate reductase alpha chain
MYMLAWERGLKTTYYLRTLSATQVEKSTLDVNQRGIQPRWMKNRSASSDIVVDRTAAPPPKQCLLDDPGCEACQ